MKITVKTVQGSLRRLGAPGVVGLGVMVACLTFYLSSVRPAQRELQALRVAAEQAHVRSGIQTVSAPRTADLGRFYQAFPAMDRLPDELERLYGLARASRLDPSQGEYRLEQRGAGLASYRITLPLHGSYPDIRGFLSETLKQMPYAAVDALRFERKKVGDTQLEAQLRLTLFFRPGNSNEIQR
jgi:hypothetical protein